MFCYELIFICFYFVVNFVLWAKSEINENWWISCLSVIPLVNPLQSVHILCIFGVGLVEVDTSLDTSLGRSIYTKIQDWTSPNTGLRRIIFDKVSKQFPSLMKLYLNLFIKCGLRFWGEPVLFSNVGQFISVVYRCRWFTKFWIAPTKYNYSPPYVCIICSHVVTAEKHLTNDHHPWTSFLLLSNLVRPKPLVR